MLGLVVPRVIPPPFSYTNIPFPVCDPTITYNSDRECMPVSADHRFRPGMVMELLIGRCYDNWFRPSEQPVGYTIARAIVSDDASIRILLDPTFSDVHPGCATSRSSLHAVPAETPNGVYHFEGIAQVAGRDYLWRSQSFRVEAEGGQ